MKKKKLLAMAILQLEKRLTHHESALQQMWNRLEAAGVAGFEGRAGECKVCAGLANIQKDLEGLDRPEPADRDSESLRTADRDSESLKTGGSKKEKP